MLVFRNSTPYFFEYFKYRDIRWARGTETFTNHFSQNYFHSVVMTNQPWNITVNILFQNIAHDPFNFPVLTDVVSKLRALTLSKTFHLTNRSYTALCFVPAFNFGWPRSFSVSSLNTNTWSLPVILRIWQWMAFIFFQSNEPLKNNLVRTYP